MDDLRARHSAEQHALQARLAQKLKQASKKTRRGVQEECARLEAEQRERHETELGALNDIEGANNTNGDLRDEITAPEQLDPPQQVQSNEEAKDSPDASSNGVDIKATSDAPAQGKKRNRARERLARRAAQQEDLAQEAERDAATLPDLKEQERQRMLEAMATRGLQAHEVRADGHCLYAAVADQLKLLGILDTTAVTAGGDNTEQQRQNAYRTVRRAAADYIETHPDDFAAFVEDPLPTYAHRVRDTAEWGGQVELLALARSYAADICVLQDFGRVEEILGEDKKQPDRTLWLAYYRHGFGLGEHYNSLRKA